MPSPVDKPLVARTRVSPWGFVVGLGLGGAFLLAGGLALREPLLPAQLGIFVAPPSELVGLAAVALAILLLLVGVFELASYFNPGIEVVIDADGVAVHGLLGERRIAWRQVQALEVTDGLLTLHVTQTGRLRPFALRVFFNRLDRVPPEILAAIAAHRPQLLAPTSPQTQWTP